jgi:hypothetical protein
VRKLGGGLLILIALFCAALGLLWGYAKAAGGEVDICPAGERGCISAWYFVGPLLVGAVVFGLLGVAALRGERHGSRSGERPS